MKKFFSDFKEFIMRGNVLEMAVGFIIATAFSGIVNSFVKDIMTPVIGIFGNMDFSYLVAKVGEVEIKYGAFVTTVINFIITAFIIFLIVKSKEKVEKAFKREEAIVAPVTEKTCPYCKSTIDIEATRCPHCTSEIKE